MGSFLSGDDPHALGPSVEVEQAGDLGDPGAVADLAVAVVGRGPHLVGDLGQLCGEVGGQGEPDRVRHALPDDPVQEFVGGSGTIDADQDLLPGPGSGPMAGQLRQRVPLG
jgi:hypothetical protein